MRTLMPTLSARMAGSPQERASTIGRVARRTLVAALVCAGALGVPSMAAAAAPAAPKLAGPAITDPVNLSGATAVAVSGQYGYVTAYNANELTAINFQNPAHPFIAGESLPTAPPSTTLMNGSTVNVSGGYAFVVSKNANGPSGSGSNDNGTGNALTILDIATDPAHPAVIGSLTDSLHLFGAYGVAVYGTYAYVAAQGCLTVSGPNGQPCPNQSVGNSFEVIDISNPQHPTIVKTLHYGSAPQNKYLQHATSVAISSDGKYA